MQPLLKSSPHIQGDNAVASMMIKVILALLPGIGISLWLMGPALLFNVILAAATAVVTEVIMLFLRKRPILFFLNDYSALVTALLLALALPPVVPWWIPVIGTLSAIILGKHLYGGLGYNPFNPAMIGFVILLISFPLQMSTWIIPTSLSFDDLWQIVFAGLQLEPQMLDSITAATPLDTVKAQLMNNENLDVILAQPESQQAIHIWQWVNAGYLLGGLWLLYEKIIDWRIPMSMLAGIFLLSAIFSLSHPAQYTTPWFHLLTGATMLGAFFIATDPITAATTVKGRLYYGFGIGLLTYIIRTWGGYPDGVAFAVLLMNMTAPMIDQLTQPKVFGGKT